MNRLFRSARRRVLPGTSPVQSDPGEQWTKTVMTVIAGRNLDRRFRFSAEQLRCVRIRSETNAPSKIYSRTSVIIVLIYF